MNTIQYITHVNSEGEIITLSKPLGVNMVPEGVESSTGNTVVYIHEEIENTRLFMETTFYDFSSSSFQSRDPQPNSIAVWENGAWTWNHEDFLNLVRSERSNRLYACDWTQLPDSPLSDEDKELWRTYRQELRDITNDLSGISSLDEITWPESPINT